MFITQPRLSKWCFHAADADALASSPQHQSGAPGLKPCCRVCPGPGVRPPRPGCTRQQGSPLQTAWSGHFVLETAHRPPPALTSPLRLGPKPQAADSRWESA